MTDRNRNALIGLFALGGIICLATLIILFGESRGLFSRQYEVKAKFKFDQVASIKQGLEVNLAGAWVGNVGRIEMADTMRPSLGLYAVLEIDNRFAIPVGSTARVIVPLMGQPIINILPPPDSGTVPAMLPTNNTAEINGEMVTPLDNIIDPELKDNITMAAAEIRDLANALTPTANALTELMRKVTISEVEAPGAESRGVTPNLYTAVERLHDVLRHFDTVLGDPDVQSNIKLTFENFRSTSESAKAAAENLRIFGEDARATATGARTTLARLDRTIEITQGHVDSLGRNLNASAEKLSKTMDYLQSVGRDLAEGNGAAGMILRDTTFKEELMLTVQRLSGALLEMQGLLRHWRDNGLLAR